jgi:hypothetical protein
MRILRKCPKSAQNCPVKNPRLSAQLVSVPRKSPFDCMARSALSGHYEKRRKHCLSIARVKSVWYSLILRRGSVFLPGMQPNDVSGRRATVLGDLCLCPGRSCISLDLPAAALLKRKLMSA